ncbi:unnamed protein product [Leptidea sinapis]|uniref:Acyltransferase 3 domain-containing protein n=1 Tax=Leptidea sinapis TaxID=189913 RepID=A0A5E4R3G3_9NEOP|nr:unnamed protein product [Leptidea sinapis]
MVHNLEKLSYQVLFSLAALTQIYFVMSGCLLTHSRKINAEQRSESWMILPSLFICRLGRVLPPIMMILGFTTTWYRHLGNGPLWNYYVGTAVRDCRQYWWSHLLFVNIFLPYTENRTCLYQTWQVSVEIHLYTIGLFIYLATRRRFRNLAFIIMFLVGLVGPALPVWLKDTEATVLISPEYIRRIESYEFRSIHSLPHNNLPGYVIGMCLGLYIYDAQRNDKKFPNRKILSLLTWMVIPATVLLFSISGKYFIGSHERAPLLFRMIFAAVHRPILAILYAFLVLSFVFKFNNFGSILADWSVWRIPSRLSYMVYIIHVNIIQYLLGTRTQLANASFINLVMNIMDVTCISFLLALPLYLLLEAPFTNVVKNLIHQKRLSKQDTKTDLQLLDIVDFENLHTNLPQKLYFSNSTEAEKKRKKKKQ